MFGRRRSSFFLCVCTLLTLFLCIFSKWKFFGKPMPGWKVRNTLAHTQQTYFLLIWYGCRVCVWVKMQDERVIKREGKKSNVVEIFFLMLVPRRQKKKPTASLQFVGGEMGDGKMLIFERNDEKHSDACIKTYTYKCAYRTRNSSAGGGGPAYSPHVCTASSAAAVTHFMWNWNEVESMSNLLCSFIVALWCLVVSLYSGSILI